MRIEGSYLFSSAAETFVYSPLLSTAIVSAVVALSQAIGSTTVVEGVETAAQLEEILRAHREQRASQPELLSADQRA